MTERAAQYGNTYGTAILGQPLFITSEPENIKALLATQFNDFGKGPFFQKQWQQFLGAGIFNADGESWSHSRALLRPQFLKERIADLDNFEDKLQIMMPLIKSGEETDVMDLMFKFTLDAATDYLFGHSAKSLQGDNAFAKTFATIQELQTGRARSGPLWWMFDRKQFKEVLKDLDVYVDRYVQLALAKPSGEKADADDHSLLAALVKESRDPIFLRDQLVSTLLAGRDTTAATLSWALKELSQHPDLWQRLRDEVMTTLGDADTLPSYTQLKNMKMLQAVINEVLRLYPIVPLNVRAALKDTTLPRGGGADGKGTIFVPKGTQVGYSTMLMQRQVQIPKVDEFVPGRWIEGVNKEGKYVPEHWTYIPFNGGPRLCLGQQFALTEIAYTLTRLAQRFSKLENLDEPYEDMGMRYDIILTPRYGVKVRFTE
ncbi:cytochrome P450 [Protomyces lactucae-debilis]|uniref:Cytochrome P450 n=1 Tax=Protomyces lactucae-debilis TaxID=2754530 RepID=A0A1Y2F836_PROLT|nr:cytochrome P450 [Protomyces lactucae-debilis]ORY79526.1 cytochrome P450 [Protomyces lactucae-debilis]